MSALFADQPETKTDNGDLEIALDENSTQGLVTKIQSTIPTISDHLSPISQAKNQER